MIVVGAGLCDGEGERAYTGYAPHILRNVFFCRNVRPHVFAEASFAETSGIPEKYIPLKTISRHSKPFWNSELTKSSEELRHLRRKFICCSNYINGEKLAKAKQNFKKQLSDSASKWMGCFISNLGQKRGRDFWASYES